MEKTMNNWTTVFLRWVLAGVLGFISLPGFAQPEGMVVIHGDSYVPLYGNDSNRVEVEDFLIDVFPVTHREYIEFLREHPKWRKSEVKAIFADEGYLAQFEDDLRLKPNEMPDGPVTNVSWFAAKAYCECLGKRLPTLDEWEYVAMADETRKDARLEDSYNRFILGWYETPKSYRQSVGSTFKNYWGVYDMHGLVWEWTSDFNSVLLSGESRRDVDSDQNLFCGAAAIGATDLMDYAAFMRYAFRGSLKGNYAVRNLGFRCARDMEESPQHNDP